VALLLLMAWRGRMLPDKLDQAPRSPVRLIEVVSDRQFRPVLLMSFASPSLTDMFNFVVPLMAKAAGLSGSAVGTSGCKRAISCSNPLLRFVIRSARWKDVTSQWASMVPS
jgi:hypothetical protein